MQTITTLEDILPAPANERTAVSVGTFDGVHRGHEQLIATLGEAAAKRDLKSAVLTFADMPYFHFRPERCSRLLTLPAEKQAAFAKLSIDTLAMLPFDASIAEQSAEEFVRSVLVGRLGMSLLVVGPDFALGKNRQGDVDELRDLGGKYGYETLVLDQKVTDGDEPISSTRIRERIESGEMSDANRMLGRPFELAGEVVAGARLGRTIGVPTINLKVNSRKVLPLNGVYAVRANIGGEELPAVLNIGTRPTVDGTSLSIEFHVIGRDIPVAPASVRTSVIQRLRAERRFDGLDALVAQIKLDISAASRILS